MCLAQGHNAVTPERLEPVAPLVSSQALYHWATALPDGPRSDQIKCPTWTASKPFDTLMVSWKICWEKRFEKKNQLTTKQMKNYKATPLTVTKVNLRLIMGDWTHAIFVCETMSLAKSSLHWSVIHYKVTFEWYMRGSRKFCQRGSNKVFFCCFFSLWGEGGSRCQYKQALIGSPAKRHWNGVSLACRWLPNIEFWLGSFVNFQGIPTSIAKKP